MTEAQAQEITVLELIIADLQEKLNTSFMPPFTDGLAKSMPKSFKKQ